VVLTLRSNNNGAVLVVPAGGGVTLQSSRIGPTRSATPAGSTMAGLEVAAQVTVPISEEGALS